MCNEPTALPSSPLQRDVLAFVAMTGIIPLLGGATALSALLAILGKYRSPTLLYVFKPATTVLILLLAVGCWPEAGDYLAWIAAGLLFSLAGDVFLMLPARRNGADWFIPGLGSFFIAHLCYIWAFGSQHGYSFDPLIALPLGIVLAGMAALLLPRAEGLRIPVAAYIGVIGLMVWQAGSWWMLDTASTAARLAFAGAVIFAVSDGVLGTNRFVRAFGPAEFILLSTYYLAQFLIALSVWALAGML